jgi:integrase/recombinase XerC
MRLNDAIARFAVQMVADQKSVHTQTSYLRDLRYFTEWLGGDPDVNDITPDALNTYVTTAGATATDGEAKARGSVNHVKSSLKSFFTWAFHLGYVRENPSRCLRVKFAGRHIPTYLTPEEKQTLLATIAEDSSPLARRDLVLAKLFLGTGMRLNEALSLNVGDVNLAERKLILRQVKGGGESVKFLNTDLVESLGAFIKGRTNDEPLFTSSRGTRLSDRQVQVRFADWYDKAGLDPKLTVHSMRHAFATHLFAKTRNILLVQRALDHRHISTTQIYAHCADAEMAAAVEMI